MHSPEGFIIVAELANLVPLTTKHTMNFDQLIITIEQTHTEFAYRAIQQVNTAMTVRNWLIGYYLVEFEQNGEDRAAYGQQLMKQTAKRLKGIRGMTVSNLFNFRHFYLTYAWFSEHIIGLWDALPILQMSSVKLVIAPKSTNDLADQRLRLPPATLLNTLTGKPPYPPRLFATRMCWNFCDLRRSPNIQKRRSRKPYSELTENVVQLIRTFAIARLRRATTIR